jgi:mRNA interferase RelE/StbE
MYKIVFHKEAQKEFLKIPKSNKELITAKLLDLQEGDFEGDKSLKGKHKGKFRKRTGNYRIIYLLENNIILIIILRIEHRKEVY